MSDENSIAKAIAKAVSDVQDTEKIKASRGVLIATIAVTGVIAIADMNE